MLRASRSLLLSAAGLAPLACGSAPPTTVPLGASVAATPPAPSAADADDGPLVELGPTTECRPAQSGDQYVELRVMADYYDRGYLEVKTDHRRERKGHVCFTVTPGLRYRLGRLHIADRDQQGIDPLGAPAALAALMHSPPGGWFSRKVFVDDLQAVRRRYRDAGYASVEADPETDLDRATAHVSVEIPIRRGPLTTIDRIAILGNVKVPTADILAALLVKRGGLFHETHLDDSKDRLLATGSFVSVDVSSAAVPGQADRVVVNFEVQEK